MKRPILAILLLMAAPLILGGTAIEQSRESIRQELLRLINRDRTQFGLQPVQLDPLASSVADAYCRQQIQSGTSGHFTVDGLAPYMRYSFAGGNDAVSENAVSWSASYGFSDRALVEMARRSEVAMMREIPPHDGHRRAILDPYATHVGIGVAWEHGEFRLTQEFIRRYVAWVRPLPRAATVNDPVLCSGRPRPGYDIDAITVHHEPLPRPTTAAVANATTTYSLPEARREYLPRLPVRFTRAVNGTIEQSREVYTDGRRGDFPISADGSFAFVVPFADGPGVYTVVVWVKAHNGRETIAASNVSIRVDDSPYGAPAISFSSR